MNLGTAACLAVVCALQAPAVQESWRLSWRGAPAEDCATLRLQVPEELAATGRRHFSVQSGASVVADLEIASCGRAGFLRLREDALDSGGAGGRLVAADPLESPFEWRAPEGQDPTLLLVDQICLGYRTAPAPPPRPLPGYERACYLFPLYSPGGALLAEDFPASHPHQRGLFFAWTQVLVGGLLADFWNFPAHNDRMVNRSFSTERGALFAGLRVHNEARAAVTEQGYVVAFQERVQHWVYRRSSRITVLDLEIEQRPDGHDLFFPVHRYGGLSLRAPSHWEGAAVEVLTDEGLDRAAADQGLAHWFLVSGPARPDSPETSAAVAILAHPDNPRFPSPMRMNPGAPQFGFAPTRREPFRVEDGAAYRARFRVLLCDGVPSRDELLLLAEDLARPVALVHPDPGRAER